MAGYIIIRVKVSENVRITEHTQNLHIKHTRNKKWQTSKNKTASEERQFGSESSNEY